MGVLDEKNCMILNLLQKNCRMSLTEISKEVGLSVDSVKKRIDRMIEKNIFFPKIQLRPRNFGYNNIVDVKIKLSNYTSDEMKRLIKHLQENPHVAEIIAVSGEWDLTVVLIAKDSRDLGRISGSMRNEFNRIISEWSESLTTCSYKFEDYDLAKLMGFKD